MTGRPYAEPGYRAALDVLRHDVVACWYGCGRRATSPDHVPPLVEHRHVAGSGCCTLRPACGPCNRSTGAAAGNRARRARRARVAGLAPGSGSSVARRASLDRPSAVHSAGLVVLSPLAPDRARVIVVDRDSP